MEIVRTYDLLTLFCETIALQRTPGLVRICLLNESILHRPAQNRGAKMFSAAIPHSIH